MIHSYLKIHENFLLFVLLEDSGLCIYHLVVLSNLIFFQDSLWITFLTQTCLVLYPFCVSLLHSLTMLFTISSLSPHITKYGIILKMFLVWLVKFLKKYKYKFSLLALLYKHFLNFNLNLFCPIKVSKKKKRLSIYDLLNAQTKPMFLCLPYTKQRKKKKLQKNIFFKEKRRVEDWTENEKKAFLNCSLLRRLRRTWQRQ